MTERKELYCMLKKTDKIWVYGAGIIAAKAIECLSKKTYHIAISGVIVSDMKKTGNFFLGYPVYELESDNGPKKDDLIIIAVSEKYRKEILLLLGAAGYENISVYNDREYQRLWRLSDFRFEDRRKHFKKVCFVLSGYKEFLWEIVFERLRQFLPNDVEVCILSSGLYSERLGEIAGVNGWSYLSGMINNLTLIQNIAYEIYDDTEWIYKMDEDMFLTEGCMEKMMRRALRMDKNEPYKVGFVAPLIPVNGYGYIQILDFLDKRALYEERFERVLYGGHSTSMLESDSRSVRFMWGEGGLIPQLDDLNELLKEHDVYSVCAVRFSIGFILFRRDLWEDMGGFSTDQGICLGVDEIELCEYCIRESKAIIVTEDTAVGHFSFKDAAGTLRDFYQEYPEYYRIKQRSAKTENMEERH